MEGGGAPQPSDSTDAAETNGAAAETNGAAAAPPSPSASPEASTSAPPDQATPSAPTMNNRALSYDEKFVQYDLMGTIMDVTSKYGPPFVYVGKGAYGILLMTNQETGESLVIKKIAQAFDDEVIAKRTLREISILRRMDHDNIIAIRDIIPPQSRRRFNDVYIAYELMDCDLQQVIHSPFNQLSEDHKQFILYQTLRGLKYIHSADVLHRDLKPSNLLLNDKCDLRICDFGLARIISPGRMTGNVVTGWYRPPELLLNSSAYTAAIDIWSVGCILMEMHNRKILFRGRESISQLRLILQLLGTPNEADLGFANDGAKWYINQIPHYAPQSFAELFPEVPPAAIDLAEKMLKFDPRQRITVEEALAHPYLADWHDVNDEPVCTTPLSFDFEQDATFGVEQAKDMIHAEALDMNPDYRT